MRNFFLISVRIVVAIECFPTWFLRSRVDVCHWRVVWDDVVIYSSGIWQSNVSSMLETFMSLFFVIFSSGFADSIHMTTAEQVVFFSVKQLQWTKNKKSNDDVRNQGQVSQVHNEHKSQLELANTARSINYLRICEALIQIQVIWESWSTLARTQLGGEFGSIKLVQTFTIYIQIEERWRLRECLELSSKVQTRGIGYCPFEFSLFGFHG